MVVYFLYNIIGWGLPFQVTTTTFYRCAPAFQHVRKEPGKAETEERNQAEDEGLKFFHDSFYMIEEKKKDA
jgi:hypothetical protein